ncbi:MAG: glyoxalase [Microcoleus sp. SIO2G3]|nr:glyoxalase [Microcoleus sp. SIO2G3]
MQITKSLHSAVLVSDLEQAEHFYSNILGLSKVDRVLKYPGAWYQVADFQLHLIVDPTVTTKLANLEKLGRNPHVALAVENLDDAKNQLLAHGCMVQSSASARIDSQRWN